MLMLSDGLGVLSEFILRVYIFYLYPCPKSGIDYLCLQIIDYLCLQIRITMERTLS